MTTTLHVDLELYAETDQTASRRFRLLYLEDVSPVDRPPLVVVGPGLAGEALTAPAAVAGSHALVTLAWPDQFLAGIF